MTRPAPRRTIAPWAALGCAFVLAAVFQFFGNAVRGYIDTASLFYWWGYQWSDPASESQHGWLILALSGWLFWRNLGKPDGGERRAESPELRAESKTGSALASGLLAPGSSSALAAMLVGLGLHAVGFAAQQTRISILALLLCVWGVLRLAGGPRWGRAAAFPVAFLVFAIPINALDSIGFWLRVWVVDASAAIARAAGIGVLQSGTQLLAPDGSYNYDVAAACSGIRSLTAMAALSLLAGYLNFRPWWRRALVLLLCFPLVYVGNVARIVAIVFAAQAGGPKWGDLAHEVMGYGVFAIVLGGILGAIAAMRRWWPEATTAVAESRISDRVERGDASGSSRSAWVAGAVVAMAVAEMLFLHHLTRLPPRGAVGIALAPDGENPAELPAFLGTEWIGRRTDVTPVEREILPADTGFSRKVYVSVDGRRREVLLSIVLSGRDRTSIHRPELCLVGQGWTLLESERREFRYPGRPDAAFRATVLRVQREVQTPRGKIAVPQLVAYWFVSGDRVVATHWERIARDAWNRVTHARADRWAYVLMQTDASEGEAAALARMQTVLDATLPAFQRPLPPQ